MKKWCLAAMCLLVLGAGAWAEEAPAKTSSVGGGVSNPWRGPYRTAVMPAGLHR